MLILGGSSDTLVGPNTTNAWAITNTNSGTLGNITFQGFGNLTGGSANDTFDFSGGGSISGKVNGGAGTNTVVGPNATATWNITDINAGNIPGVVNFSNIEDLTGGSAGDTFKFSNGKGVTGLVDGRGGTDTLDYSAYTTGVTVNLTTGTATGTGGVKNIENVTGSPANDSITGSSASNVISGDGGIDTLKGGSGGDDTFVLASTQGASTTIAGAAPATTFRARTSPTPGPSPARMQATSTASPSPASPT